MTVRFRGRLGVGHSYKFINWQLVKYVRFSKNLIHLYEWGRTNLFLFSHLVKCVRIALSRVLIILTQKKILVGAVVVKDHWRVTFKKQATALCQSRAFIMCDVTEAPFWMYRCIEQLTEQSCTINRQTDRLNCHTGETDANQVDTVPR